MIFLITFNIAQASSIVVKVEDMGLFNWETIEDKAPGFGSDGPITLDWDPNNDFFTELLAYNQSYSKGAAAFCWYGDNCALELKVSATDTTLMLKSFTLGYFGYGGNVQYEVIDLKDQTVLSSGAPWISGSNDPFIVNVNASSEQGFLILFGPDGYNGGINNIAYEYGQRVVPTPLPSVAWLFASGLFGLISFGRKRSMN